MSESTTGAKTLERGLGLLDLVAGGTVRLDEIAASAGLSRSAAHRMLSSLVKLRFLALDPDNQYHLGIKLLQLGSQAEARIDLSREIQTVLQQIAKATSDTTHLGVLVDADVLYLAKARGHRGVEMASRPGGRLRAQNTAMGKVLLSQLPQAEAAAMFDPSAAMTPNSVTTVEGFIAGLAQTRAQGYALEDQENELGITCVAIGIPDLTGRIAAAISVSSTTVHMPHERIPTIVELLHRMQPEVTSRLPRGFERVAL